MIDLDVSETEECSRKLEHSSREVSKKLVPTARSSVFNTINSSDSKCSPGLMFNKQKKILPIFPHRCQ